jgi:23S rRNA (uracil1939-C5)-methyltransferase
MNTGDRLMLAVERPAAGGRMIARHAGGIVLVAGTMPGELVEASVEKIQRGTVWARTVRVVQASPDRVDAPGDSSCGGNVFAHVAYPRQLGLKAEIVRDAFARIGRLTLDGAMHVAASPTGGYRMRARLHVKNGRVGFFREGTHELCDAASTSQLRTDTVDVVRAIEGVLLRRPNTVREVELSENRAADQRALHLVVAPGQTKTILPGIDGVAGVRGISWGDGSLARAFVLSGTPEVSDTIAVRRRTDERSVTLTRQARSFFQGNRYLLQPLVDAVTRAIGPGRVLDLYAGVGLFSVTLAARGDCHVVAIEGERSAATDLQRNAAPLGAAVITKHLAVEDYLRQRDRPGFDSVLVDPPRTGMTRAALRGAMALQPARMVYVSCDVATLARDARALVDGGYTIGDVQAFDLFPNTAHVETLAIFDRSPAR